MRVTKFSLLFLGFAGALAAATQISTDKPVINFRLPAFTPDGHRSWLVRGSEALFVSDKQIDIKELTLSIFSGRDGDRIETVILSPAATVRPSELVVTGESTIRVINDDFEVTGAVWKYEHREKKVSIAQDVRVTFHAEIKDFLQ